MSHRVILLRATSAHFKKIWREKFRQITQCNQTMDVRNVTCAACPQVIMELGATGGVDVVRMVCLVTCCRRPAVYRSS
jgi:hypothetical protein